MAVGLVSRFDVIACVDDGKLRVKVCVECIDFGDNGRLEVIIEVVEMKKLK